MKTPTSSPSPTRGLLHWTNKRSRIDWSLSPSRYRGAAAWVLAASPLLRMPPLPARRPMLTTAPGMLLRSLFTRARWYSARTAPRTRTRLPCTPALAPPNRARLPRTSPTACAMGRQRTPPPCLPKAPRLQLPLPHEHQSHARAWRVRRLAKPYRVSLPPITRRSPSSSHRSKQAPSAPCSRSTSRDSEESTSPPRLSPRPKRSTPTSWK